MHANSIAKASLYFLRKFLKQLGFSFNALTCMGFSNSFCLIPKYNYSDARVSKERDDCYGSCFFRCRISDNQRRCCCGLRAHLLCDGTCSEPRTNAREYSRVSPFPSQMQGDKLQKSVQVIVQSISKCVTTREVTGFPIILWTTYFSGSQPTASTSCWI